MLLARTRLILIIPALRPQLWESQHATALLFTDALTAATKPPIGQSWSCGYWPLRALATLATALMMWVDGDGAEDLTELVDQALAALRRGLGSAGEELCGELRGGGAVQ